MSDFDHAEESRERNEGLYYEDYRERILAGFDDAAWCPTCSREVIPYLDQCQKCGTLVEPLGTGDDAVDFGEEEEDE